MFFNLTLAMLTIAFYTHASPILSSAAPSGTATSDTCIPGQYQCTSPDTFAICTLVGVSSGSSWAWAEPQQMAEGTMCEASAYPGPYSIALASSVIPATTYTPVSSVSLSTTSNPPSTSATLSASLPPSSAISASATSLPSVWSSSSAPSVSITSAGTASASVWSSITASATIPPPLASVAAPVPMTAQINNSRAVFEVSNQDSTSTNPDVYTFYSGDGGSGWPAMSQWMSFDDLWARNQPLIANNCNQTDDETQQVAGAIQAIAETSLLDHRHILATIMQESKGCVRVQTTSYSHANPGLMQSFNGTGSCNNGTILNPCPPEIILQMVQDGSMGVMDGDAGTSVGLGLVQHLNNMAVVNGTGAQAFYQASRMYNAGSIPNYNDLGSSGATECYVSDIANRLTGWATAPSGCVAGTSNPTTNGTAMAAPTYGK